jgi:hypothetical protein
MDLEAKYHKTTLFLDQIKASQKNDPMALLLAHLLENQLEMNKKFDSFIANNVAVQETIQSQQAHIDSLLKSNNMMNEKITAIEAENKILREQVVKVNQQNTLNKSSIDYLSQWRIDRDIIISGFPNKMDSTVVLPKLASVYGSSVDDVEYHYSFSRKVLNSSKLNHFLVLGFNKKAVKTDLFSKLKSNGPLYFQQICPTISESGVAEIKLNITNRFTVHNLNLRKELFKMRNDNEINKVVYKNCCFYIQKSPESQMIAIKSQDDINNFKASLKKISDNQIKVSKQLDKFRFQH